MAYTGLRLPSLPVVACRASNKQEIIFNFLFAVSLQHFSVSIFKLNVCLWYVSFSFHYFRFMHCEAWPVSKAHSQKSIWTWGTIRAWHCSFLVQTSCCGEWIHYNNGTTEQGLGLHWFQLLTAPELSSLLLFVSSLSDIHLTYLIPERKFDQMFALGIWIYYGSL